MAATSAQPEPTFLGVPCEIRMLIYDKLVGDRIFWVNFPLDKSIHYRVLGCPAIMRVNKQVRDEAQRAVKVRSLRVNKLQLPDAKLLLRVPGIVSRWAPTIENVLIGYGPYEFDVLLDRSGDARPDQLLTGLKHILLHLPKLATVTITCDNLPLDSQGQVQARAQAREQELEKQLSSFSEKLVTSFPQFNRIQIQTRRRKNWAALSEVEEVEIKLFRTKPYLRSSMSALSHDPNSKQESGSTGRKVLLDVIKISDIYSKSENWLTINDVNQ